VNNSGRFCADPHNSRGWCIKIGGQRRFRSLCRNFGAKPFFCKEKLFPITSKTSEDSAVHSSSRASAHPQQRHCRHSDIFNTTTTIASTGSAACLFIDPGLVRCATPQSPPAVGHPASLSPVGVTGFLTRRPAPRPALQPSRPSKRIQ
jgi:hypothetical protein